MNLPFGYELRKVPKEPDIESGLFEAVDAANKYWALCRRHKINASLWIDWAAKELIVTEFTHTAKK